MKRKLRDLLLKNPLYLRLVAFLQRIRLGKARVGLYDAILIFIREISDDEILRRANGVAFSFTMAIFPAIIFLFTLVPYIQTFFPAITPEEIIRFLDNILPDELYNVASATIHDIIERQRAGLLSFGFIFTLILSTNGMIALMRAFNACYKTVETRGIIRMRLVATGLIFILALSIIFSIALLVVGRQLLNDSDIRSLIQKNMSIDILFLLRFTLLYIIFQLAISSIYYFAPAVHERWHFFSIGSVFSSLTCIFASFGISFYVNNFDTYNKLYGSIGMLIVLMIWLFIISLILLVGFEMNAAIDRAKLDQRATDA